MFTLSKRSILPILLSLPLMGAVASGPASHVSAAPAATVMQAAVHGNSFHLRGANFRPGSKVSVALINTRRWEVVFRGETTAEAATYTCPKSASIMCGQRDPAAGSVYLEVSLPGLTAHKHLAVLYRSSGLVSFNNVR